MKKKDNSKIIKPAIISLSTGFIGVGIMFVLNYLYNRKGLGDISIVFFVVPWFLAIQLFVSLVRHQEKDSE